VACDDLDWWGFIDALLEETTIPYVVGGTTPEVRLILSGKARQLTVKTGGLGPHGGTWELPLLVR